MTYQQKLEEARKLLSQHNSQTTFSVDVEQFFKKLTEEGGTNEDALSQCSWEDLQEFGLPKLLARQVAQIFRFKEKQSEPLKRSKVEVMTVAELIARYDPRTPDFVSERLGLLFKNNRFVVFDDSGAVDRASTTKLALEIFDGYPERQIYMVEGEPRKTYALGERPDQSFDENPLYPGRILRQDGDCDQTNRSWNGVPLEVRQTLYLAVVSTGELKIDSINAAHAVMDLIMGKPDVERMVRQRFVKAAALLKDLYKRGQPPLLKVFRKVGETKKNDPFGSHRSY